MNFLRLNNNGYGLLETSIAVGMVGLLATVTLPKILERYEETKDTQKVQVVQAARSSLNSTMSKQLMRGIVDPYSAITPNQFMSFIPEGEEVVTPYVPGAGESTYFRDGDHVDKWRIVKDENLKAWFIFSPGYKGEGNPLQMTVSHSDPGQVWAYVYARDATAYSSFSVKYHCGATFEGSIDPSPFVYDEQLLTPGRVAQPGDLIQLKSTTNTTSAPTNCHMIKYSDQ